MSDAASAHYDSVHQRVDVRRRSVRHTVAAAAAAALSHHADVGYVIIHHFSHVTSAQPSPAHYRTSCLTLSTPGRPVFSRSIINGTICFNAAWKARTALAELVTRAVLEPSTQ